MLKIESVKFLAKAQREMLKLAKKILKCALIKMKGSEHGLLAAFIS